jgi:hypothetical protein
MSLKAGHVNDFSGSLAEAIETAMAAEWQAVKGEPMPSADPTDRRILFVAIARGLLKYLEDHRGDMVTSITMDLGVGNTTFTVDDFDLDTAL